MMKNLFKMLQELLKVKRRSGFFSFTSLKRREVWMSLAELTHRRKRIQLKGQRTSMFPAVKKFSPTVLLLRIRMMR